MAPTRPHTAVKRELLVRYLDAWLPAVLHGARRVTYADGYPGSHTIAALRACGEFTDRLDGRELTMAVAEPDPARRQRLAERLRQVHAELGAPAGIRLDVGAALTPPAGVPTLAW